MLDVAPGPFCCRICRWKQGERQLSKPWHEVVLSVVWACKLATEGMSTYFWAFEHNECRHRTAGLSAGQACMGLPAGLLNRSCVDL